MEENNATPQTTIEQAAPAATVSFQERLFGALSYLAVAVLATIVSQPNSEYCKFHARQGVVLVAFDLAFIVLTTIALTVVKILGYFLFVFGLLALLAIHAYGFVQAFRGVKWKMPIVHEAAQKIDLSRVLATKKSQKDGIEKAMENVQAEQVAAPQVEAAAPQPAQPTEPVQPAQPVSPAPTTPPTAQPNPQAGQDMVGKAVETMQGEQRNLNNQ